MKMSDSEISELKRIEKARAIWKISKLAGFMSEDSLQYVIRQIGNKTKIVAGIGAVE